MRQLRIIENILTQPPGYVDQNNPNLVCKLRRAIYGHKQAPQAWYNELKVFLLSYGFVNSHSDASLFIYHTSIITIYFQIYVDDLIVTGNDIAFITQIMQALATRFSCRIRFLIYLDHHVRIQSIIMEKNCKLHT